SLRVGGPALALAESTLPYSSITTSTVTTPAVLNFFAISGYPGLGKSMAVPLRTPPEMGLRRGLGETLGGSDSSCTSEVFVFSFGDTCSRSAELITFKSAPVERGTGGADFSSLTGLTLTLVVFSDAGAFTSKLFFARSAVLLGDAVDEAAGELASAGWAFFKRSASR